MLPYFALRLGVLQNGIILPNFQDASLYLPLLSTVNSATRLAVTTDWSASLPNTAPHPSSHLKLPQRAISFSPPSQHPILDYPPITDETLSVGGTVNVLSCGLEPIPVTFSASSHVCTPLAGLPHIFNDLTQRLLSKTRDGILFPLPDDSQASPLPIYLRANITEQLYRSKYVLSLSLKLSPLESTLKRVGTAEWRSIVELLEQSVQKLDKAARERDGTGLGSVLVIEADIERVHILAEWRVWSVVDGLPVLCES